MVSESQPLLKTLLEIHEFCDASHVTKKVDHDIQTSWQDGIP